MSEELMTDKNQNITSSDNKGKLGIIALIAVVVCSMLGGGVFSLPQNSAVSSAVGPVIIAWIIAGIGIYFIANSFRLLSDLRPDLNAGVYMYAQEGFGSFVGFNVAWGYWLMTCLGNVAFAVLLMDAFDDFFPGVFTGGNNLTSIICGSILIWGYNFLVLSGIRVASKINVIGTIAVLVPLTLFILILGVSIDYVMFSSNIWGTDPQIMTQSHHQTVPVTLLAQIVAPITIALWSFIGVEGAVVLSGRAKKKSDVGKATLIGFIAALVIYILISVLPFGVMTQAQLSVLPNPSIAGVLGYVVGNWGDWLMNVGLIISILTGWLAWTMLCAEIPMVAGEKGAFPKAFAKKNKNESATVSLWVSSGVMQAAMLLVYFSDDAWVAMYSISALMVVPAYFAATLYMAKICYKNQYAQFNHQSNTGKTLAMCSGVFGAIFCIFILYASEFKYVALIPFLLTLGLPVYIWSRKEKHDGKPIFEQHEKLYLAILLLLDVIVVFLLFMTDLF